MSFEWFLYYANSAAMPLVVFAMIYFFWRSGVKIRAEQAMRADTTIELQRRTVALLEEIRTKLTSGKN